MWLWLWTWTVETAADCRVEMRRRYSKLGAKLGAGLSGGRQVEIGLQGEGEVEG